MLRFVLLALFFVSHRHCFAELPKRCKNLTAGSLFKNCGEGFCKLKLCKLEQDSSVKASKIGRTILLGLPREAVSPWVCREVSRGGRGTGVFRMLINPIAGEAQVRRAFTNPSPLRFVPISQFREAGWAGSFNKDYLKFLPSHFGPRYRGVARSNGKRDQLLRANGLCARIPIVSYQIEKNGKLRTRRLRNDPTQCVEVAIVSSRLSIELLWDSADDLDLRVTEPDGTVVNRIRRSGNGSLLRDMYRGDCSAKRWLSKEIYENRLDRSRDTLSGTYKVEIVRNDGSVCRGPFRWRLVVLLDGKLIAPPVERVQRGQIDPFFNPFVSFEYDIDIPPLGFVYRDPRLAATCPDLVMR